MSYGFMKFACIISALAMVAPTAVSAKAKAKNTVAATEKTAVMAPIKPRMPGYAILRLENAGRDELRVAEGEMRATIPNIMANDVDFITVVGNQTVVTVYDSPNFQGHSLILRCGSYELLQQPRNDIESVKVSFSKTAVSECQGSENNLIQLKTWNK